MFEVVYLTKVANTVTEQFVKENGERTFYKISPVAGYKLHTKELDYEECDEQGRFVESKKGFTKGFVTCAPNYDFEANPREIYAVAE